MLLKKCVAISIVSLWLTFPLTAQQADTSTLNQTDTSSIKRVDTLSPVQNLKKTLDIFATSERTKSIEKYKFEKFAQQQDEIITQLKSTSQAAREYLKAGLDTLSILKKIQHLDSLYKLAQDGIFTGVGTSQTHRNLTTTNIVLRELLVKAETTKRQVDDYRNNLYRYKFLLDSLNADSALYEIPTDSSAIMNLVERYMIATLEIGGIDSALDRAVARVHNLQRHVTQTRNSLRTSLEEITKYRISLHDNSFNREFANIWGKVGYRRPFSEVLHFSFIKDVLALKYYVSNNIGKTILCLLIIIAMSVFIRSIRRELKNEHLLNPDYAGQLVFRYPVYSAIFIGCNLLQFIFPDPPFVFSVILWVISAIFLTIIFWGYISGSWMWLWLLMTFLFLVSCFDNTILQATRVERWIMLCISVSGVICGSYFLIWGNRSKLREKLIIYFILFVVVLELLSSVANIFGRYNIGKTLLVSGYVNLIIAIMFLWTVRLINEVLAVTSKVYTKSGKKILYIDFQKVGQKVPPVFYVFLIIGWVVVFGRNFYAFSLVTDPILDSLSKQRTIGNYQFSIDNVLVFIIILILSTIISKVISFFASDYHPSGVETRKGGVGSWILLIRIAIISIGVFLACAAAGIPMDRITLIIGALGVGIGLGLQELTNSLVSGLIIAFEKPINVGDIVDVAGQSGIVKSIGFRSSVISTWDGADVVIPNGSLLTSNLVNWTMSNMSRRMEILVGVAYGTDLQQAKELVLEVLGSDERILKKPPPSVLVKEFSSSSIDLRILFWVGRTEEWFRAKSDMMMKITESFKVHAITIPFPQQDIYLHPVKPDTDTKDNEAGKKIVE